MARILIIGCGCRGRLLGRELVARGHAVRGTTRDPERTGEIEAAGIEPAVGDPGTVGTLVSAFEHVSVACVLLGCVSGVPAAVGDLHGSRLEMLLTRLLDTTVRGIVYEAAGDADEGVLERGAAIASAACAHSRIPLALLREDPHEHARWLAAALHEVDQALS